MTEPVVTAWAESLDAHERMERRERWVRRLKLWPIVGIGGALAVAMFVLAVMTRVG